ncbi:E3 ubiquitin-protein ligase PRT1 [Raphanus sativus]|nr:E3 ubiquitin-protein ligase PRT1 [Raphanus sativus]
MDEITMNEADLQEEEISHNFLCCVCLELLYKPIVLSCGHISCFWCVHKSMSGFRVSHCPICRDPYLHFPTICQKLHFLLKKLYPIAHNKREAQLLKDEQARACFSPQIDEPKAKLEFTSVSDECSNPEEPLEDAKTVNVHENDLPKNGVSKDDLLCSACKDLLVRPVVLNCGHVYCEGCVVDMMDQESEKIICKECHVCDPRRFPKVCLALEQLLEESFPEEYSSRRSLIQKKLTHNSRGKGGTSSSSEENSNNSLPNTTCNVHIGVGCDSCGVYPIIGERYRCRDCKEKMGYDLCKACYESPSKVPGRFNQQHTPDHRFKRASFRQLLLNLNSVGILLAPMVREGVNAQGRDESQEGPHDSNESSSPST